MLTGCRWRCLRGWGGFHHRWSHLDCPVLGGIGIGVGDQPELDALFEIGRIVNERDDFAGFVIKLRADIRGQILELDFGATDRFHRSVILGDVRKVPVLRLSSVDVGQVPRRLVFLENEIDVALISHGLLSTPLVGERDYNAIFRAIGRLKFSI